MRSWATRLVVCCLLVGGEISLGGCDRSYYRSEPLAAGVPAPTDASSGRVLIYFGAPPWPARSLGQVGLDNPIYLDSLLGMSKRAARQGCEAVGNLRYTPGGALEGDCLVHDDRR
jgi:hypothetical protein